MSTTFEDAKVGDRVWSILYGWGTIVHTYFGGFKVEHECKFMGTAKCDYTTKGCLAVGGITSQVLFWDEIKFTAPEQPKRKVKKVLEGWVNVYEGTIGSFHKTEAEANLHTNRIACVYINKPYEVEE